jgi:hypothetical protein
MTTQLIASGPQTRTLKILSDHWSWVPVFFLQSQLEVSSQGFDSFVEEMAKDDLIELSEDKTQVRYIRTDYGRIAQVRNYFSTQWYAWLVIITIILVSCGGVFNTTLGAVLIIGAFFSGPLWFISHMVKNALKKENE